MHHLSGTGAGTGAPALDAPPVMACVSDADRKALNKYVLMPPGMMKDAKKDQVSKWRRYWWMKLDRQVGSSRRICPFCMPLSQPWVRGLLASRTTCLRGSATSATSTTHFGPSGLRHSQGKSENKGGRLRHRGVAHSFLQLCAFGWVQSVALSQWMS